MTDTKTYSEAATEKEAFTQTFTGLPLRKLRQLLAGGWAVNGVSIERTGEDGTIQRGAVTTGGMVLWWNHVMQLPPVGKLMLWDAEDPESTGGPWHDIVGALEGIGGNRDLNVGDEVTLMCAIEQPSYKLRITSIPGEDSDSFERVGYELVGPVAPAQPAPVPDETLLSFYQATDFPSLVAAMEGHIKKMQGKLQANPHTAIDAWNDREMHRTSPAQPAMPLTNEDLDRCRQWFDSIQDTNPNYLNWHDCVLAVKLYSHIGLRVPDSLKTFRAHGITTAPQQGSAAPRTCTWTPSGDPNMPGTWAGSCGAMWTFTEDGPVENGLHFCHKCGGELIIEEATHADA